MKALVTAVTLFVGVPLCAVIVISGVVEYPYLIVLPLLAVYLIRLIYLRVNARFQRDVAALVGRPQHSD